MITDIRELPKRIKAADPRSVWGVVSLIAAIIALAIVARLLVVSAIERDHLQGDLDATRARIAQLQTTQETDPEVLHRRIEDARHELRAVLAGFPTTQQADDEIGRYAQYASELGTQLVRLEAMLSAPEDEVQPAYREQRFLLGVRGDMPQLLRFLGRVSNVPYRGLVVDNITIRPDGAVGDATDGMANADLAVYASGLAIAAAPFPEQAAAPPTDTAGQSDNISEIEAFMWRAIADQDWAAATAHGRHILQIDPGRQDSVRALYHVHLNWGRALAAAGLVAEAQQQFTEALALVPGGQEALEAQEGLLALATPTPGPAGAIPRASPLAALPEPTAGPPLALTYTVRHGDTLSSIAARHGSTVAAVMQANNLGNATIYAGQQLVIPGQ